MQRIKIPQYYYSEQEVAIGGNLVIITIKYNSRNQSFYLDIKSSDNEVTIKSGIKVTPNQNLTARYNLDIFEEEDIYCYRLKSDYTEITLDNFGIDKSYELLIISKEEQEEIGIDGIIQL